MINYNYKKEKTTAVGLIGANRPEYLSQVIDSIAHQLDGRPFYLFIDISPNGDKNIQNEQIKYTLSKIPEANIIKHETHMGCGRNMIAARRYLFDWERYRYCHILEDDTVLSEGHFSFSENAMKWCESNFPNVGIFQAWSETEWDESTDPYELQATCCHFWTYLQSKNSWDLISNLMYTYENLFLSNLELYNQRGHREIMGFRQHVFEQSKHNRDLYKEEFFPRHDDKELLRKVSQMLVTGQDGMTMLGLWLTNQARVAPTVGRGKQIGKIGEHFTPELFDKHGYDNMGFYSNPLDSQQTEFSVAPL